MLIGAAALLAMLFATGCPQEAANENGGKKTPDVLVAAIDIGAVQINPLPAAGSQLGNTPTGTVVINTERPPTADEIPEKVYYRPVQPVVVTLADANQTAYFADSAPDEYPASIERPGVPDPANPAKVKIDLRIATTDTRSESKSEFLVGRTVWIKVVSADESKTEYYRINVAHQNHDAAMSAIAVNGHEVLNANQTPHIGAWEEWNTTVNAPLSTWQGSLAGLVSVTQSEAAAPAVEIAFRNNVNPLAAPNAEYAKIAAVDTANAAEPAAWSASVPASFANNDELAVKVTASNGKTKGYFRIKIKVGGIASLTSLSVNGGDVTLGTPHADPNVVKDMGAFRVEDYALLENGAVTWTVVPTASDPQAAVTWALKAKGIVPQASDYGTTSPLSFDTSNNYLWLKVASQSGDHTMYYLVIYDERPKDTEHIVVGNKNAPIYKFTIPSGKTWADLGENPVMRLKVYMQDTVFNEQGNNHRNFVFGEISKFGNWSSENKANFYYNVGGSGFNTKMPFLVDRIAKDLAVDPSTAAPNVWFTIQYELTELPNDKRPWDPNTDWTTQNAYDSATLYPDSTASGDVYFAAGISSNGTHEYWLKEISLESRDGTFKIFCDLLGDGRVDSPANNTKGWAVTAGITEAMLREMVADPSLR